MIKKIIFLFAWLGIFILSILGINFILFPDKFIFYPEIINLNMFSVFDLKIGILAICVLYIFICLYKFVSLFEGKKEYVRKTESGIIRISNSTINSYVNDLLKKDSDIGNIKVSSDGNSKNFFIRVKLQILHQLNLEEKINEIQDRVKDNLRENLGIEVKDVFINITNISAKENKNKVEAN